MDFLNRSGKLRSFTNDQSVEAIGNYLRHFTDDQLFEGLKDFNLLLALNHAHSLPCKAKLHLLLQAIKDNDVLKFTQFLQSNEWLTTRTILEASSQSVAQPSNGEFL